MSYLSDYYWCFQFPYYPFLIYSQLVLIHHCKLVNWVFYIFFYDLIYSVVRPTAISLGRRSSACFLDQVPRLKVLSPYGMQCIYAMTIFFTNMVGPLLFHLVERVLLAFWTKCPIYIYIYIYIYICMMWLYFFIYWFGRPTNILFGGRSFACFLD